MSEWSDVMWVQVWIWCLSTGLELMYIIIGQTCWSTQCISTCSVLYSYVNKLSQTCPTVLIFTNMYIQWAVLLISCKHLAVTSSCPVLIVGLLIIGSVECIYRLTFIDIVDQCTCYTVRKKNLDNLIYLLNYYYVWI